MKLSAGRLDVLVWVLIYGGLLLCGLGIALARDGQPLGWSVTIGGAVAAFAGTLLIWVRSRMHDTHGH